MRTDRLLNVARALRETKPGSAGHFNFDMAFYVHSCGTPACALCHYAARRDLQDRFRIDNDRDFADVVNADDGRLMLPGDIAGHFEISVDEVGELFEVDGCDDAQTPVEAAEYIEAFVARAEGKGE
jgi:hypothetical protein